MTQKQNVRPTTDPTTGEPFAVFLPRKGRTIKPEGEALVVDSYLEKRILDGELERFEPPTPAPTTSSRRGSSTTAAESTPSTGA